MTIGDVYDFYVRRDVGEALGTEDPCTGCDTKLQPGEAYSNYDVAGKPRTPRAFPHTSSCVKNAPTWSSPGAPQKTPPNTALRGAGRSVRG